MAGSIFAYFFQPIEVDLWIEFLQSHVDTFNENYFRNKKEGNKNT